MSVGSAYAYFDKEGNLKEFISDSSVRKGNVSVNDIYIYIDELDFTPQNITVSYKVINELNQEIVEIQGAHDFEVSTTKYPTIIPSYKDRDLKFFVSGKTYLMFKVNIQEVVTSYSGSIAMSTKLYKVVDDLETEQNESVVMTLGVITFYIENSAVYEETNITQSQFDYLLSLVQAKLNIEAGRGIVLSPSPDSDAQIISTKLDYEDVIINID